MRFSRVALLLVTAAGVVACRGAGVRPTKERPPLQTDFDRCYVTAKQLGNQALQGTMTLKMYVDGDGSVPFAYVNDVKGLDSRQLNHCIMDFAVSLKYPAEGLDYLRPYSVSFAGASSFLPDPKDIPANVPVDEALAQDTLEMADWATPADRGFGFFYVHKYKEAIDAFQAQVQAHPDDVKALRGLAVALAATGGDLKAAREAANKAIQLKPDSEATHEALLRVCIAEKNDECIYDEFEKARKAPDMNIRSIELASLQDQAKAAADRLQSTEHTRHEDDAAKAKQQAEEAAKKADPLGCGQKAEGDERTLCYVQGCFAKGGKTYADSLQALTGQEYSAGEWKIAAAKNGASKVTLPIRAKSGQPHDANWEVKVGESIDMKPLDIDANNIATQYNACRK